MDIAASMIQSQGTVKHILYDGYDAALTNNDAFKKALQIYRRRANLVRRTNELGVGDTRQLFTAGQCALAIDWGTSVHWQ